MTNIPDKSLIVCQTTYTPGVAVTKDFILSVNVIAAFMSPAAKPSRKVAQTCKKFNIRDNGPRSVCNITPAAVLATVGLSLGVAAPAAFGVVTVLAAAWSVATCPGTEV